MIITQLARWWWRQLHWRLTSRDTPTMRARCNCTRRCPHNHSCLGGHANYPDDHWYPCSTCTPTTARCPSRYTTGQVVVQCCYWDGHAADPDSARPLHRSAEHRWADNHPNVLLPSVRKRCCEPTDPQHTFPDGHTVWCLNPPDRSAGDVDAYGHPVQP